MVLEIALTNFFSINEKITLDLQAANIQTKEARALAENTFSVGGERLLKTVAIYGANASGKSNIIKGVKAAVDMILDSHNYNEGDNFGFKPFKFGGNDAPSEFYIRFIVNEIEHEYSFSCTREEIITESLYYYPKGRKALIFSRDERKSGGKKEKYEFTTVIRRPMDVASNTSRKTLFLSRASQMDRDKAKEIYRWFNEQLVFSYRGNTSAVTDRFLGDNKDAVLRVLKAADSDIVEFSYKDGELTTFHRRNPLLPFDFNTEESEGTKILFRIMLTVMDVVRNNKTMFLDEVETSLHTRLVEYLINLFHNSRSAQLIFTTHNTHLLDMTRFRKDQIFFVNKRDDGSSDLYSLFDYKDFREKMDLEKAYLQGRFDAVPYVNEFENI
jgi:AAA15 family ATPase/GTPase